MATLTLTERVYHALSTDHGSGGADLVAAAGKYPRHTGDGLTGFELDCRDWGLAYGIAYGIARGEDAFEPEESVQDRVLTAARDAFARWGGSAIFTPEAYAADRADKAA